MPNNNMVIEVVVSMDNERVSLNEDLNTIVIDIIKKYIIQKFTGRPGKPERGMAEHTQKMVKNLKPWDPEEEVKFISRLNELRTEGQTMTKIQQILRGEFKRGTSTLYYKIKQLIATGLITPFPNTWNPGSGAGPGPGRGDRKMWSEDEETRIRERYWEIKNSNPEIRQNRIFRQLSEEFGRSFASVNRKIHKWMEAGEKF